MITLSAPAMRCMLDYDWPGNVRELENCIERAVALGSEDTIELQDLPPAVRVEQSAPAATIMKNDLLPCLWSSLQHPRLIWKNWSEPPSNACFSR